MKHSLVMHLSVECGEEYAPSDVERMLRRWTEEVFRECAKDLLPVIVSAFDIQQAAKRLAVINEDKPLVARFNRGTAVAVIADLLDQAQEKRRAKDVAEYLVGAKLELRFGEGIVTPKNVNTPSGANLADFRIGNMAIEVTTVERPDKSHLDQLAEILGNTGLQIWFLTRLHDRERWQTAIDAMFGGQASRVVVADVETFVGQNITEIGRFQTEGVRAELSRLFEQYSRRWLPPVGAGGLRIVSMEDLH